MDLSKHQLEVHYLVERLSTHEIAAKYGTYATKIMRLLRKHEIPLRSKSQAQKEKLDSGKVEHPTKGKERSNETKNRISQALGQHWELLDEDVKKQHAEAAKKRWDAMSIDDKEELQKAAGKAARRAADDGSKLEHFLLIELKRNKIEVDFHKEHFLVNEKLQLDLYLPDHNVAIEVDGPRHFLPINGQEALLKKQKSDIEKNGLLLSLGVSLIRVKQESKTVSNYKANKALATILGILNTNTLPSLYEVVI